MITDTAEDAVKFTNVHRLLIAVLKLINQVDEVTERKLIMTIYNWLSITRIIPKNQGVYGKITEMEQPLILIYLLKQRQNSASCKLNNRFIGSIVIGETTKNFELAVPFKYLSNI